MPYEPKVYREQGGNVFVVLGRAGGIVKGQTSAAAAPAQAAAVAAFVTGDGVTTGGATKLNAIRVALQGVGILATS